jgi:hypothetical protein
MRSDFFDDWQCVLGGNTLFTDVRMTNENVSISKANEKQGNRLAELAPEGTALASLQRSTWPLDDSRCHHKKG